MVSQKIYTIENLDCANCAAKAEEKIRKVPGVEEARIVFATMQLRLTAEDPDSLLAQVQAAARQVEPDILFLPEAFDHGRKHTPCGCEHSHVHHHDHDRHKDTGLWGILLGAGLFAGGILWSVLFAQIPMKIIIFMAAWLVLGWKVITTAGKNLLRGHIFDENFLMSIATLGAFVIGEYPEAVGVMLFYRVGEYFEHRAVARSRSRIMEAVDLRPETVNRFQGEHIHEIPAQEAKAGDLLLVRPGDRIPLDGQVVSGESYLDTAPITGEPVPVRVRPGDPVVSGCINTVGQLVIQAEKPLSKSMVTQILNSVENAAAGKPRIDRFITRFARIYTPVVVAAAAVTAIVPSMITGDWSHWVYTALSFLVISCPCALVLSVPLAFFSGIGAASQQGILFKGGAALEALAGVRAVVMDKTGTLTEGNFVVQQICGSGEAFRLCASCEASSAHPIAVSILAEATRQGLALTGPEWLEELPGHGIRACVEGKEVLCGNEKLLRRFGIDTLSEVSEDGAVWVYMAVDGKLEGRIQISDTLRPDAGVSVKALQDMGIRTAMLTGDGRPSALAAAEKLGIPEVYAQLLPEEKLEWVKQLRQKWGPVMFVGDGINDAPVLSGADVGAAMGKSVDAAMEAADVVFLTGKVQAIVQAIGLAADTKRIAWQNVAFALGIKALVMVLGLAGYASMWTAVFADSGVAMLCVLNSIRTLYRK